MTPGNRLSVRMVTVAGWQRLLLKWRHWFKRQKALYKKLNYTDKTSFPSYMISVCTVIAKNGAKSGTMCTLKREDGFSNVFTMKAIMKKLN